MNLTLPTTPRDWLRWGLGLAILAIVYYAFGIQIVESGGDVQFTCYSWLRNQWRFNYSHGPLIPLMTAGLLWFKWDQIQRLVLEPRLGGNAILVVAMLFYFLGVKAMQPRLVTIGFVVMLYGLTLTLGGREAFRCLFFPITFLFLMVPLNFLDTMIGFPLQMFMARAAELVLNLAGIEAVRIGTGIRSAVFDFDVANPCSGIRSLMALTTVTAAFGYVTQPTQLKRWILFLCAIPLAVLGNLGRVITIALVGQVYGKTAAVRVHDYSGLIVFGVALTAMVAIGILLNLPYRAILSDWLRPVMTPSDSAGVTNPLARKESHE